MESDHTKPPRNDQLSPQRLQNRHHQRPVEAKPADRLNGEINPLPSVDAERVLDQRHNVVRHGVDLAEDVVVGSEDGGFDSESGERLPEEYGEFYVCVGDSVEEGRDASG